MKQNDDKLWGQGRPCGWEEDRLSDRSGTASSGHAGHFGSCQELAPSDASREFCIRFDRPVKTTGIIQWGFATSTIDAPSRAEEVATAWTSLPGGVVDGGEIVILAIKPSMWKPAIDSVPWLIAAGIAAGLLAWLRLPLPGLSLALTLQLVLGIGFARLGLAIARWIPTWHVLTNRRIIDVHGVRAPVIDACSLIDIRNTYLRIGLLEQPLRIGSIAFVQSHETDAPRLWPMIPRPDEVHAQVRRAIENALDQQGH